MLTSFIPTRYRNAKGFSLLEIAIVLTIVGILLSGLLVAFSESTESSRRIAARNQLRMIEEALYGFAQANGRLPCPSSNVSNGFESPVGGPVAGGTCTVQHGFVPNASLGVPGSVNQDGLLTDPWQNPYRYSIASRTASDANMAFTHLQGLSTFFNNNELSTVNMLRVCDISLCTGNILSNTAPAVVISMGENWPTFTSANETANGGGNVMGTYSVTNTNDFVDTIYNEATYDDIILWLSPHILYNKLISAGKLP